MLKKIFPETIVPPIVKECLRKKSVISHTFKATALLFLYL